MTVYIIECGQLSAVNVKHGNHLTTVIKHWYDNLRLRFAATRNMSRELFNVRYDDSLCPLPGCATHPFSVWDMHTCNWALEGAKHQLITQHPIESCPPESHRLVNCRSHIAHNCNQVLLTVNQ